MLFQGFVHAGRRDEAARRQRRLGPGPVDVAQNGLGLAKPEAVMLEDRNAPKGMDREIVRRPQRIEPEGDQPIRQALLFEGDEHAAHEGATDNAVHDDLAHRCTFRSPEPPRRRSRLRPRISLE